MSQLTAELCVLLVNHIYGELPSRTLGTLFLCGRLPFGFLLRRCDLNQIQLQHSLAVLVQTHLIYWYTSTDSGITFYEANPANCYNLVRSGKYIAIAEERLGKLAGELVAEVIQLGHARVTDLMKLQKYDHSHVSNGTTNGDKAGRVRQELNGYVSSVGADERPPDSARNVRATLSDLLHLGLLCATHESHFRTYADNRTEAEALAPRINKLEKKMKKEEAEQYEQGIAVQLEAWKYGDSAVHRQAPLPKSDKKRSRDGETLDHKAKRPRLTNDADVTSNGSQSDRIIFRINHDKFTVVERNDRLVRLAKSSIGTMTAIVYAKALQTIEPKVRHCREHVTKPKTSEDLLNDRPNLKMLPQATTDALHEIFAGDAALSEFIGRADKHRAKTAQEDHPKKRRRKEAPLTNGNTSMVEGQRSSDEYEESEDQAANISGVESDSNLDHGEEDFDPGGSKSRKRKKHAVTAELHTSPLQQHLLLLANQSCKFLHRLPPIWEKPEAWSVDYNSLSKHLLITSIFEIANSRFGPLATRLLRILRQKGKLDEKTLTSLALINQKSTRAYLSEMNRAGFIELQEIPKDNNRQPGRMIFLWFFDEERCRKRLLDETFKAMTRVLQRVNLEKEKSRYTVEKSERTDVQGREDELLNKEEKRVLNEWRAKEERLLGELGRLDDLVAVLRDF